MKKFKVFYSVQNGGDGSAYPTLMESEQLVNFDQDHMSEGWGEPCTGSFEFESESPIKCLSEVKTKEGYFIDRYIENDGDDEERAKFLEAFFPKGLPHFTVKAEKAKKKDNYVYNDVFVGDRKVARVFLAIKESGEALEAVLNK